MNFKLNVKKVIVSLVVGVIICYFFFYVSVYPNTLPFYYNNPLMAIVIFIGIYVIWSLFQKKEIRGKKK